MPLPSGLQLVMKKSMGIPFYVIICFPLAAFNTFSLSLTFDNLIIICLGAGLIGLILLLLSGILEYGSLFLSLAKESFPPLFL